jgi:pimeloyl-ACP methyl ester carboxylesterase
MLRTLGIFGWIVVSAVRMAMADAPAESVEWVDTLRGNEVGRETVTTRTEDGRWVVASEGQVAVLGVSKFSQTLVVDANSLAFIEYELSAETASGAQKVAAERTEGGVRFDVEARGQTHDATASVADPVLCLDNLVLAHYAVLGRKMVGRDSSEPFSFTIAVPSVMKAFPAEIDPGVEVPVRIGETVRTARQGKLTVAGLLTHFWYDAETGAPYRVAVPAQELDAKVVDWGGIVEEESDGSTGESSSAPTDFREHEVHFASSLGEVPGVLTLPAGDPATAEVPVIVMLSGSGPNDRDETIGPNKPFRDVARGLAAKGIATLRYDKRSAIVRKQIVDAKEAGMSSEQVQAMVAEANTMTLGEEYLVDARAALAFVREQASIRDDAVFLLGHSLGGVVAPELAAGDAAIRGVILMAAPGRPFGELIESQIAFQATVAGMSAEDAASHARERTAPLRAILRGDDSGDAPDEFMNASAAYWRDVAKRDVPKTIEKLAQPVLLLQGGKDIQITVDADFEPLKAALDARSAAPYEARVFPSLNHLFIPVAGRSTGAEYFERGHVDAAVVGTIAEWMRGVLAGPQL